jgi:hypothetical protein
MANRFDPSIGNIKEVIDGRQHPSLVGWNRLEGRPRTAHFDRALKAEVRDALWMLTRQWQMGEFKGEDAGSLVFAQIAMDTRQLKRYQPALGTPEAYNEDIPLEATVERQPIALSLDMRLLMGRHWLKLLKANGFEDFGKQFCAQFAFKATNETNEKGELEVELRAHPEVLSLYMAVSQHNASADGRIMDGGGFYRYLKGPPVNGAADFLSSTNQDQRSKINDLSTRFVAWFERLYLQPSQADPHDAWLPERLEYQFACSTSSPGQAEKILSAEDYHHGHLDWYNLDLETKRPKFEPIRETGPFSAPIVRTMIPTPVSFAGMPNTRWWALEDHKTNFADFQPSSTDLAKLLVMEFGLVYANDWFLVPFTLPLGSIAQVAGIVIQDSFGQRFWIDAAGAGNQNDWQRWSMFALQEKHAIPSLRRAPTTSPTVLLLPTVPKLQEGPPREEVLLIRDEMANMVWGIEKTVALADGSSKSGAEAASESLRYRMGKPSSEQPLAEMTMRYQVMNTVPEHWIPFIPVHQPQDQREIRLQRAAMPRILKTEATTTTDPPQKVRPRTQLLRHGLESQPAQPYYLHEEEVPRTGVRVTQTFQRTRWHNGKVIVWLGIQKEIGRGEGSSGLAFDQLIAKGTP